MKHLIFKLINRFNIVQFLPYEMTRIKVKSKRITRKPFKQFSPDNRCRHQILSSRPLIFSKPVSYTHLINGGKGGVVGTFFGVILLSMISTAINMLHINAFYEYMVYGIVILLALAITAVRNYFIAKNNS